MNRPTKSFVLILLTTLLTVGSAQAGCSKNDSRLANCDSPLGTAAYTHVEISRENCVITATVFQPTQSGEPAPVLASVVTGYPAQTAASGLPDSYKGTNLELTRTDGTGTPLTGEFAVHLNAEVSGKKVSEDLKCYL